MSGLGENDLGLSALMRGCAHVYSETELKHKLETSARTQRPLRVKLGMDPTAPDIHLGHTVVLRKLRQFQDLGHTAVLIIGDFTAKIGDPTGRSKTRPVLTDDEIAHNAETYLAQAGRVLDTRPERFEVRRNSEWLAGMNFAEVIRLTAKMTVGQMLKREDFRDRYQKEEPISLHELLYPLVQGWDSVNIRSDVELGGTDQTYNNLVGRDLQVSENQAPQVVMTMPLLRGTDGVKKMSKSIGNCIAVLDPSRDVFGKTMSIPDELLPEWFTLLTDVPEAEWQAAVAAHPMRAKDMLAQRVGSRLYSSAEMAEAAGWWHARFGAARQTHELQILVPETEVADGCVPAWKLAWLAHAGEISRSDARRMVEGGAFEFDGEKITDPNRMLPAEAGRKFRAGRHRSGELIKQPLVAVIARA